jgi:hypothetical protein
MADLLDAVLAGVQSMRREFTYAHCEILTLAA